MKIEIKQDIKLLDFVLDYFPQVSVTKAKKMILYNCFFMQGASLKSFEYVLHKGETIEYQKYNGGQHIAKEKRGFTIVYEDKDIIVVNKPADRSVTEYRNKKDDTLYSMTKSYLKRKYHKNDLFIVFAPQEDESGLILMAKNRIVLHWLENQKESFVYTISAVVENALKHKNDKIHFFVKEKNNTYSVTKDPQTDTRSVYLQYKTKEDLSCNGKELYHIEIRQNGSNPYLNRYLLSQIGNPVYGDALFNKEKQSRRMLRYCINSIELLRPVTNKKLKIETTLPVKFTSVNIPVKTKDKENK